MATTTRFYYQDPLAPKPNIPMSVGAVVIIEDQGKFLLEQRSDCGLWGFVGGHMEAHEDLATAARREVKEETGLELGPLEFLTMVDEPSRRIAYPDGSVKRIMSAVFHGHLCGSRETTLSPESHQLRWFSPHEIPRKDVVATHRPILTLVDNLATGIQIRDGVFADAPAIAEIYNHYIATTTITFEELAVSATDMAIRMADYQKRYPYLVLQDRGRVVAYAYASPWRVRSAYRFSAEVSVYVHKDHGGKGHGSLLYQELLQRLTDQGVHLAIAGIALPNQASIRLHEKFGFTKTAHFSQVGYKFDTWLDVGYWQRILG